MLRIHFTAADLSRVVLSPGPDPLFEVSLAVRALQQGTDPRLLSRYRRLAAHGLHRSLGPVFAVVPPFGDTPDFVTPLAPGAAIADAVEAVAATPRARMRAELGWLGDAPNPYVRRLASGDREAVGALVRGLHTAYDALVAPDAEVLARWTAAERAARAADVLDGGVHRLLGNLCPDVVWEPPVLRLVCQVEQGTVDLYLDGQGLVLQPCFGRGAPGVVIDAAGPPVLAYPMADPGELMPDASLAAALGATRARVLATMSAGATTSQIATRLGISAASASEHATVLRAARLVTSRRLGPAVLHTLTPLGRALLAAPGEGPGESPGDGRRRRPDPVGR